MCNQTIQMEFVQTKPKCLENVISSTIHMYSCMLYLITSTLYSKKINNTVYVNKISPYSNSNYLSCTVSIM